MTILSGNYIYQYSVIFYKNLLNDLMMSDIYIVMFLAVKQAM